MEYVELDKSQTKLYKQYYVNSHLKVKRKKKKKKTYKKSKMKTQAQFWIIWVYDPTSIAKLNFDNMRGKILPYLYHLLAWLI